MPFTPAIGFGGKLEIDPDWPTTPDVGYVDVGHVKDFGMNIDVADVDVSHQQSNAGAAPFYGDAKPGKVSLEVTFNCNLDPGATEHEATLLAHIGIIRRWQYTFKDGSVWRFNGFYKTINAAVPAEDRLSGDVTIRITGAPTFTGA